MSSEITATLDIDKISLSFKKRPRINFFFWIWSKIGKSPLTLNVPDLKFRTIKFIVWFLGANNLISSEYSDFKTLISFIVKRKRLPFWKPLNGVSVDCVQTKTLLVAKLPKAFLKLFSNPLVAPNNTINKKIPHKTPIMVIPVLILFLRMLP